MAQRRGGDAWIRILQVYRRRHRLSKMGLVRLLQRRGLPDTSWLAVHRWERGTVPISAHRQAIRRALSRPPAGKPLGGG